MVYPATLKERKLITDAVTMMGGRHRSVSAFMMDSALKVAHEITEGHAEVKLEQKLQPHPLSRGSSASAQSDASGRPETPAERAVRLTEKLRGLLKDELAEYGGGEAFIKWIRSEEGGEA